MMHRFPVISVIIPIHNAGDYLLPCLNCIEKQTLRDFECLCINDGSTDTSRETIQKVADRDSRFYLIDIPASGAAVARNHGITKARGKYLLFLDADDLFATDMLELLYNRANETDADIVMCKHKIFETNTDTIRDCTGVPFPDIPPSVEYPFRTITDLPLQSFSPAPWNKFFRADFIRQNQVEFQPLFCANDIYFTTTCKLLAQHVATVSKALVFYRTKHTGNISEKVEKDPTCIVSALEAIWMVIQKHRLENVLTKKFIDLMIANLLHTYNLIKNNYRALLLFAQQVQRSTFFHVYCNAENITRTGINFQAFKLLHLLIVLDAEMFARANTSLSQDQSAMNLTDISIVIPIFNAQEYIKDALLSCCRQTIPNIEIIVVDDGSSDQSFDIASEVANEDPRIFVLRHNSNRGTFVARKTGALVARGKYITYLDPDDTLPPDACESFVTAGKKTGADIIHGVSEVLVNEHGDNVLSARRVQIMKAMLSPAPTDILSPNILPEVFIKNCISANVCGKALRQNMLRQAMIAIDNFYCVMGEDQLQFFLCACFAKKYTPIRDVVYRYSYGRGITGKNVLTLDHYKKQISEVDLIPALSHFAHEYFADDPLVIDALKAHIKQIYRTALGKTWKVLPYEQQRDAFLLLKDRSGTDNLLKYLAETYFCSPEEAISFLDKLEIVPSRIHRKIKTIGIFYYHLTPGGIQHVIASIIPLFLSLGYRVVLLLDKEPQENACKVPDDVKIIVLKNASIGCNGKMIADRMSELKRAIEAESIDLLYHHAYASSCLLWDLLVCKLGCGIPFLEHFHNTIGQVLYGNPTKPALSYTAALLRMCDSVITLGRTDNLFLHSQGVHSIYIPNPPRTQFLETNPKDSASRFHDKIILWVARISWEKHPLDAIGIFDEVHRRMPDAKMWIVGGGEESIVSAMRAKIDELNLGDTITYFGEQVNPKPFYEKASVFLMTSALEGFPLTLMEAGLSGLPTVMYKQPYLEAVRGNAGIIQTEHQQYHIVADALYRVLTNEKLYFEMSGENRSFFKNIINFDYKTTWGNLLAELQNSSIVSNCVQNECVDEKEVRILLETLQHFYAYRFNKSKEIMKRQEAEVAKQKSKVAKQKSEVAKQKSEVAKQKSEVAKQIKKRKSIENATAYKVGMFITAIPRAIWRAYKKMRSPQKKVDKKLK